MKELKKINLETMRERMQVLSPEEERIIAGGATIDDCISALRNSGYDVNVYSDPNEVPEDLWNSGASSSSSSSSSNHYSASRSNPGSIGNPYYLDEVIVQGEKLDGKFVSITHFNSISEYAKFAFNTSWHEQVASNIAGTVPVIGTLNNVANTNLQNSHANALSGLLETGCPNNKDIFVSIRQNWDNFVPEYDVRIYDSNTGKVIYEAITK